MPIGRSIFIEFDQRIKMKTAGGVQAQLLGKSQEARGKVYQNTFSIFKKKRHVSAHILCQILQIGISGFPTVSRL